MGGRLPDLRVLVEGFVSLSARAAAPPPPPPAPEPEPEPAPPPPARPEPPSPDRIFTATDAGIIQPVIVQQNIPSIPAAVTTQAREKGSLELLIDENGRVTAIKVRASIHPLYDAQLVTAAREWRYRPATVDGYPVKFRKLVQISVKR
jgi:TonB family protein